MRRISGQLKERLARDGFVKGAAILIGATAGAQFIAVIASPILTRLYSPSDFGVLAVYVSLLATMVVIGSLRFEYAIPLPKQDSQAAGLLLVAMSVVVFLSFASAIALWFAGPTLSVVLGSPELGSYLWLLPIGLVAAGVNQILTYWTIRKRAYNRIARTKLSKGIGMVITQVGVGAITSGPVGLLMGDVVGRSAGSFVLAKSAWQNDRSAFRRVRLKSILMQVKRYRKFPLISAPASVLNSAGVQMPAILFAALYGPHVAGLYALSQRVAGAPMLLIGTSVSKVYIGQGAEMIRMKDPSVLHLFTDTSRKLLLVGLLPVIILGTWGPDLFAVIFGVEWSAAGQYARILSIMFLVQFIVTPLSHTLNMLEMQNAQLLWDAGRFVVAVSAIVVPAVLDLSPSIAVMAYGAAMVIAYVIMYIATRVALIGAAREWEREGIVA